MAVSNTPKAVIKGWTALAIGALGAYMISKAYTNHRLQQYTATGSVTNSNSPNVEQPSNDERPPQDGDKPLRRSVQRSL
ncbi:hypothetical protein [Absidia glauca]|uniref:Uncharacterized protein n=1 Tax=Absidia glauca TaxID=4829 RepID=A0A163MR51_ABSGL|nr:hypothetical protein [Absidia glauca]